MEEKKIYYIKKDCRNGKVYRYVCRDVVLLGRNGSWWKVRAKSGKVINFNGGKVSWCMRFQDSIAGAWVHAAQVMVSYGCKGEDLGLFLSCMWDDAVGIGEVLGRHAPGATGG